MAVDIHQQNTADVIYREEMIHVATISDNGIVAVAQQTKMQLGTPRASGIQVFIRNTYPAMYNHVVQNMNVLGPQTNTKDKFSMRGGHFLLYRYIILFAILLCFSFGIASIYVKPCAVVPFVLSTLYIVITIYNIVVFFRNRPLLHPLLAIEVQKGLIPGDYMNKFYKVPINATVLTGVFAAFINPDALASAVCRENIEVTEIQMMFYDHRYKRYSQFPKEIVVHLIIFIILFILAIAFVSTTITKPSWN